MSDFWTAFIDFLMAQREELEALTRFVVIIGIPLGLIQAWWRYRKEQKSREYGTYNALDERYIDFQRLCLTHPYLDVFDVPDTAPAALNPVQKKEELIAFTLLFSIFERAFLMYSEQPWWGPPAAVDWLARLSCRLLRPLQFPTGLGRQWRDIRHPISSLHGQSP